MKNHALIAALGCCLAWPVQAQEAAAEEYDAPNATLRNPELIGARINAQMRRAQERRQSANAGGAASTTMVVKIDEAAVREAKARGVPISLNVCSVIAQRGRSAPAPIANTSTNIACTVQGVGG